MAMELKNCTEVIVTERLERMLEEEKGICTCEKCKMDMLTYALNQLPPRYVSCQQGEIFSKIDGLNSQYIADILRTLVKAIKLVSANPRHS